MIGYEQSNRGIVRLLTFNTATLRINGFSDTRDGLGVRLCPGVEVFELRCELSRCGMGNRTMVMVKLLGMRGL